MKKLAYIAIVLLGGASMGLAQDLAELEADHSVHSELVTPHTAWAKPYALGKTRVLLFCYGRDVEPREAIELKQRFDLEVQMVFWNSVIDSSRQEWHGGARGLQRMARLLTQPWDVFVFMTPGPQLPGVRAVSPELMPTDQQCQMLSAVSKGAGLVLIGVDDRRVLKEKNRLKEPPVDLHDVEGAAAFTVAHGRGVQLPARPKIEYRPGWEVAYDHWAMQVGKAILWAAKKEPPGDLVFQSSGKELPRSSLPGTAATVQWQRSGRAIAEFVLRRDDGTVTSLPTQTLVPSQGPVAVQIPRVCAGNYYLDVIARQEQNVVGFGSLPLRIVSQLKVDDVALDRDWAEIGEPIGGRLRLSGRPSANHRLVVSLRDRRGREIAQRPVAASAALPAFQFDVQPWFPMLVEVRAALRDESGEVSSASRLARVVKRHRDRFNFVIWDTPRGNLAPWAEQALADSGVTIHLTGAAPKPQFAAYEMAWIPYTTHLGAACQPVCWADNTKIQAHIDEIVKRQTAARQHGVFAYSLGDEIVVRGSCVGLQCLAAYRKYLQEQYGTVAALNASWGINYASFDEVQLSKPDDNQEAEALRAGNFPRWFDRQAFQSSNFCKLCERFGEAFRRIDPASRCGFEGTGTFKNADDLDAFVRSNGFWSPYPGTADEVLRSVAPCDFPRSNWMGYTKDADTLLEQYWRMITRGCQSVWWWRWEALGKYHGWLSPTLDPYPAVKELLQDTQIVRDGLGKLLGSSEMQTDRIGILFSLPSAYAAKVQVSPTYGSYEDNHVAFHRVLRELGLNFLYFTDRQMRLGEVDLKKFRVVILPLTQAIGDREAEMLRTYVRDGGVLVADVRPAIYDNHVKPLASGQLDDLFGVKRAAFPGAQVVDGQKTPPKGPTTERTRLRLPKIRVDTGVAVDRAHKWGTAGKAPLLTANNLGKGRAVLLNFAMSSYPDLGTETAGDFGAAILQALFARGPETPFVRLTDERGSRLRNVEITRWTNGAVQIVSVFRHHGSPEVATMHLPQPLYVYDLKRHADLGKQQAVGLAVTPYRAVFYALSLQRLGPVGLSVKPAVSPGALQRVLVTGTLAKGQQAAKVQVVQPNGQLADWVSPTVITDRNGATVDVPVARNDPRGLWTASATELYTGKTTSVKFRVE